MSELDAEVKFVATDETALLRVVISFASAFEMLVSIVANELDAVANLAETDPTAELRADISVESEFEMAVSFAVSELVILVRLDAIDDTAEDRVEVSVESAFETEFNFITALVVNEILELVCSSVTISPSVSNADGALPIRVLIAALIAELRLPISALSAVEML